MKKMFSLILTVLALTVVAKEIDVAGTFPKLDTTGVPVGWNLNKWKGFMPSPTFTADGVLHVSNVQGSSGFGISSKKKFFLSAGDKFTVTAKVKGTGRGYFGMQTFNAKSKWIGVQDSVFFDLTSEWKDVSIELTVKEMGTEIATKGILTLGGAKESELYIKDLKLSSTE